MEREVRGDVSGYLQRILVSLMTVNFKKINQINFYLIFKIYKG